MNSKKRISYLMPQISYLRMDFEIYLRNKQLSVATIKCYMVYLIQFLEWMETGNIDDKTFTYNELLDYINYLQQQGNHKKTINGKLGVVRHYANHLIEQNQRSDNAAAGLYIKGNVRKLPVNLLEIETIEQLYKDYNNYKRATTLRKMILGLLLYQGLRLSELKALKCTDIKLNEGKVFVSPTKRTNGRALQLKAVQVPLLQYHLQQNKSKKATALIPPQHLTQNRIASFFLQLKKFNTKAINIKQLRSSVIAYWLRSNNLRQTQYMAGHKYVSSTQRYQTSHIEDLQKALRIHHPNA